MKNNYKKAVAGILAAAMVLSNFSVVETRAATGGNTGGSGGMEGTLSDVFNVVVPTEPSRVVEQNKPYVCPFDFILDPKGLVESSPSYVDKSLEPNASVYFKNIEAGSAYDYSSTSDGYTVINKSTADVDVTLEASLTGMDDVQLTSDRTFTDDKSASAYLAMTDNMGKLSAIDKFGAIIKTTLKGQPDAYNIIFDFAANKYRYEMKSDAALEASNIRFTEYIFRLTGACNSASSWSKLSNYLEPAITVTWHVAFRPKNLAPSIPKTSYVMSTGNAVSVGIDLGAGSLAATGIKSITYKGTSGSVSTLPTSNYVFSDGTLKFRAAYISNILGEGVQAQDYVVTFNDNAQSQKTIKLVANDNVAPSIAQTGYTMYAGQPVDVDVDLGAGTLGATGIESITFVKANGTTVTLSTDDYVLTNGVLRFRAAYITTLFDWGITARTYTIIFNDKAKTRESVTLSADGTAPSIGVTEYVIKRGEAVTITVDRGTGGLAAEKIKSITYVNLNGVTKTVPVTEYTFIDDELVFTAAHVDEMLSGRMTTREYVITFDNAAKTQAKVTFKATDSMPSVAQTAYIMHKGQPVQVGVDLGSGSLRATGIQSITFVKANGTTVTLSADDYVLVNGILEFTGAYITTLFDWGITTRTYTITFNDEAKTQETVTLSADGTAPSIGVTEYTIRKGEGVSVAVDKGTGELAAEKIRSITYVNLNGVTKTVPSTEYSFANGELKFTIDHVNEMLNGRMVIRDYVITFDNVANTQAKITFKAIDAAPSIAQTGYIMHKDQPVQVNVDLGSGSLKATGIQSITFVKANGSTVTLTTNDYVLLDGVLKFRAAYITPLFDWGITTRTYTITFNDVNKTQATVTLSADGTIPSIGVTEYTIKKGEAVTVAVDKGTGELAADKIQSITYVNLNGVAKTVPTTEYTFINGELKFTAFHVNEMLNGRMTTREYIITFDNPTKTQAKIRFNAENIAPSIVGASQYTMVKDQPILIDIDLGSGEEKAAGIKSITYMDAGVEKTVPASYYVIIDGKLKLRAAYINGVIDAKVSTRNYKVTFDNAAKTQTTITLNK